MIAIIILGKDLDSAGKLLPECIGRLEIGIQLYHKFQYPIIMSSQQGGIADKQWGCTIAEAMYKYALSRGVPSAAIYLENKSRDTLGNAYYCAKICSVQEWNEIILVTDSSHMPRSRFIFSRLFSSCTFVEAPVSLGFRWQLYELKSWPIAWLFLFNSPNWRELGRRLRKWHPYYRELL